MLGLMKRTDLWNAVPDGLLALGAVLKGTRLVTQDTLGEWLIVAPLRRRALAAEQRHRARLLARAERELASATLPVARRRALAEQREAALNGDEPLSPAARAFSGLECPHCVSFWVALAVLGSRLALGSVPALRPLLPLWRVVMGALTASYAVGHVSARLDT